MDFNLPDPNLIPDFERSAARFQAYLNEFDLAQKAQLGGEINVFENSISDYATTPALLAKAERELADQSLFMQGWQEIADELGYDVYSVEMHSKYLEARVAYLKRKLAAADANLFSYERIYMRFTWVIHTDRHDATDLAAEALKKAGLQFATRAKYLKHVPIAPEAKFVKYDFMLWFV